MGQTGRKRRTVVEGVLGAALRELQARLERVDFSPVLDDLLLFLREAEGGAHCIDGGQAKRDRSTKQHTHGRGRETPWLYGFKSDDGCDVEGR